MAEIKARENSLLEKGDTYFLYRPRVGVEKVNGFQDVERVYILLKPWRIHLYRLLIVGRKTLPDSEEHAVRLAGIHGSRCAERGTRRKGVRHENASPTDVSRRSIRPTF
jgi:hypothetical protein